MNAAHYDHQKLAKFREAKLTQKELAKQLGVVEMTIYRAENGIGASYELLLQICTAIGVDIREILRVESVKNFSPVI